MARKYLFSPIGNTWEIRNDAEEIVLSELAYI